jgi:type VI secretion system protein ImpG
MQDMLPYYERELGLLRNSSREFAQRYPKIAAALGMTSETCEDPHVEHMIESFAFLTARISKKLEDDYPEFTNALLDVLYPHYLRPFPSCSIAQCDYDEAKVTAPLFLRRGSTLKSNPIDGVPCLFRTVFDVQSMPIKLVRAQYFASPTVPNNNQVLPYVTGRLSITFASWCKTDKISTWEEAKVLRTYLHGDPSLVAVLRDLLMLQTEQVFVDVGQPKWGVLNKVPLRACGYAEDEALIDFPASSHPAYRLLSEYFAFPEKFNFFDIELADLLDYFCKHSQVTLHLMVKNVPADSSLSKLLETTSAENFQLGCTPVVNLFDKLADPIRLTHKDVSYPVLADARDPGFYEVYKINRVSWIKQSAQGDVIIDFQPFYSLRHGETPEKTGGYWFTRYSESIAVRSPGYETEITLIDIASNPAMPQVETLSLQLTCSNRNLPSRIVVGQGDGDLFLESGSFVNFVRLLRRPSRTMRFAHNEGMRWRLISHLALNHLSLVQTGLLALKETLKLYDLANSSVTLRQIEGITELTYHPATIWMPGKPFASFVRGIEVHLTLDLDNFVGASLHGFVTVLDHFFALYVHMNSFIQLVVFSKEDNREIMRCPPCSGNSVLA